MNIFVVPASTKTATAAIRSLLQQSSTNEHLQVKALYRDTSKAPVEFTSHPNFEVLQGDIADASSLDFTGADAVLTLTPPIFDGSDIVQFAESVSQNVKDAIERAGTVQRLVLLSSVYAHLSEGVVGQV